MKKFITFMTVLALAVTVSVTVAHATGGTGGAICQPTSFTAQEYTLQAGEGTVLHWDSQGCDSAAIHPADYPGDRPPYGTISTGAIMYSTEYSLTVYDEDGNIGGQRFLTINIEDGDDDEDPTDCEIDEFNADDTSIEEGDSTDLNWETTGCDYVTLSSVSGHLDADDSRSVHPSSTTTYTLKAYDEDGNLGDTDTVRIVVEAEEEEEECSIDSFTASPSSIDRGDSSTLRWNTSGEVDSVTISNVSGNRADDGSVSVSPSATTSYTLRAKCNDGSTETDSVTVYVDQNTNTGVCDISNFYAGVASITRGQTTSLIWNVSGSVDSINITPGYSNRGTQSGFLSIAPSSTTTYSMVARCDNGTSRTASTTVVVRSAPVVVTTTPTVIVRSTSSTVVAQSAPSLLELRVQTAYDRMCVGGVMDYTISYRNLSNQTLENTVLRFTHPKEITYVSSSRGEYEVIDRTMTIELGSVRPGEEGTITIHARVNETAIRGNLTVATATVVYTNTVTRAQENAIAYALVTVSDTCPNVLGASVVGFGSFLPATLLGWLLLILVILALIVLGRQFYRKNERSI